jgi:hypothetical protein
VGLFPLGDDGDDAESTTCAPASEAIVHVPSVDPPSMIIISIFVSPHVIAASMVARIFVLSLYVGIIIDISVVGVIISSPVSSS